MQTAMSFYIILDGIVMLIVAVIVANTLLMAVFERIREMGILAALGMKGRQIMQMMLFEATVLSLFGVVFGIGLGVIGVLLLTQNGMPSGEVATVMSAFTLDDEMRARLVPGSGAVRYYHTYYRNASSSFCPPETFNVTNGWRITW